MIDTTLNGPFREFVMLVFEAATGREAGPKQCSKAIDSIVSKWREVTRRHSEWQSSPDGIWAEINRLQSRKAQLGVWQRNEAARSNPEFARTKPQRLRVLQKWREQVDQEQSLLMARLSER